MQDTFEFRRFGRVLRYTWLTQPSLPYIVLVAALPFLFIFMLRQAASDYTSIFSEEPVWAFNFYFTACGWLYAGLIFGEFGRFGTAHRYLLLPASVLEKWLAKILFAFLVFPLVIWLTFCLAFQILGVLTVQLYAFRFQAIEWDSSLIRATLFFFFLSLPGALASGIVWKRFGILKGGVLVFVLLVLLYFIIDLDTGYRGLARESMGALLWAIALPFSDMEGPARTRWLMQVFWVFAAYLPALLLLGSTYLIMKKKEV